MNITDLEKSVLETAKDHMNYTIGYMGSKEAALEANLGDNAGWFGVEDVAGDPKQVRGAISSLVKKGLLSVHSHTEGRRVKVGRTWKVKIVEVWGDIIPTDAGLRHIFAEMM